MNLNVTFNSTSPIPSSPPSLPIPTPHYLVEDISGKLLAVTISAMVLSVIFAALRCTTRIVHHSPWGLDDYLLVPSLVTFLATCSICIVQVTEGGVGRHMAYMVQYDPEKLSVFAHTGYATEILYALTVAFSKLSILAFYLRIFTPSSTANIAGRYFRVTVYITAFVLSATALACIVTSLVSCQPLVARWNPMMPKPSCINLGVYWFSTSIPNVITDVVMLALPLPGVWRLKLSRGKRLGLIGVFVLGSLGLIASITRLSVVFSSVISVKRSATVLDASWVAVDIAAWSLIEAGSYIIAACLPTLRPLFMDGVRFMKRVGIIVRKKTRRYDVEDGSGGKQLVGHVSAGLIEDMGVKMGSQTVILGVESRMRSSTPVSTTTNSSLADTTSNSGEAAQTMTCTEEEPQANLLQHLSFLPPLRRFPSFSLDAEMGLGSVVDSDPRNAMKVIEESRNIQ